MSDAERATFDRVCNSLACAGSDIVRVLTLRQNRGKGYAVKTGMMHARGKYLLMVDADGATRIGECETPRRQSSCLVAPVEAPEPVLRRCRFCCVGRICYAQRTWRIWSPGSRSTRRPSAGSHNLSSTATGTYAPQDHGIFIKAAAYIYAQKYSAPMDADCVALVVVVVVVVVDVVSVGRWRCGCQQQRTRDRLPQGSGSSICTGPLPQ